MVRKLIFLALLCLLILTACSVEGAGREFSVRYKASEGGRITGECEQAVLSGECSFEVVAVPDDGYIFDKWSDGLESASRYDKTDGNDLEFTAYFRKINEYTLRYSCSEGGIIEGESEQRIPENGSGSGIYAVAQPGYRFDVWSDGVRTATRTDDNVVSDLTVTAIFKKIIYVSLTYTAESGGVVKGEVNQSIEIGLSGTLVSAVPDIGYKFVCWSDGKISARRTDQNVREDLNIIAYFEKETYSVKYLTQGEGTIDGEISQTLYYGETTSWVTAVVTDEAEYEFVGWSDGVKTKERRDIVTESFTVYAKFREIPRYTIEYVEYHELNNYGYVEGETKQIVKRGESTEEVVACSKSPEWIFLCWDDGETSPIRKDENITRSRKIRAIFEQAARVNFFVDGDGGKIDGITSQIILSGSPGAGENARRFFKEAKLDDSQWYDKSKKVQAMPLTGYVFAGWSDGVMTAERSGENFQYSYDIAAYFEPEIKVFKYDYNGATSDTSVKTVSVIRDAYREANYVVPSRVGYEFAGWYADRDYKKKVVNDDGKLMLGRYVTALKTDTLYARWISENDETLRYKILFVLTDKIQANLPVKKNQSASSVPTQTVEYRYVDTQMTIGELHLLVQADEKLSGILNDWLNGIVEIDVNTYILNDVVDEIGFNHGGYFYPRKVAEVQEITKYYDAIIGVSNLHDFERVFLVDYSGLTESGKYAAMDFDRYTNKSITYYLYGKDAMTENVLEHPLWLNFVETAIHEFIHTLEWNIDRNTIKLHAAMSEYYRKTGDSRSAAMYPLYREFLLNQATLNGEKVGIPLNYWEEVRNN